MKGRDYISQGLFWTMCPEYEKQKIMSFFEIGSLTLECSKTTESLEEFITQGRHSTQTCFETEPQNCFPLDKGIQYGKLVSEVIELECLRFETDVHATQQIIKLYIKRV